MSSTMTINDLAEQVLGLSVLEAFDRIELEVYDPDSDEDVITIDEMVAQYLSPKAAEALSEVELNDESAGWDITIHHLELGPLRLGYGRWQCTIQGYSLLVIVITIAALLLGVSSAISLLQALPGLH
jgi:hypothetical protein